MSEVFATHVHRLKTLYLYSAAARRGSSPWRPRGFELIACAWTARSNAIATPPEAGILYVGF